ncbi:tetratricopeptide repeat protein [Aquimarina sp. M1]
MQLSLTSSIEKQLKTIINNAITSGKIQTDRLRMIIISPNKTFDLLNVTYNNEWDEYYYESEYNDASEIGSISIHSWLDIADEAFENRKEIDSEYIEKAKSYSGKYHTLKPVLSFDHIQEETYKNFLICLREELLEQINKAICYVATSYDSDTFHHVVGFIVHNMIFDQGGEADNQIIAFNHPNGGGPFYKVMLSLPKFKLTYPYLKFYETGFHLFYPESNIYEGSEDESNIYAYDITDFNYGFIRSKRREKAAFRLKDEFEDWELSGGHIEEEEGDLSEESFFNAYELFLKKFPDKRLDTETIPDPTNNILEFKKWLEIIINNNLVINNEHKKLIYSYGEQAYKTALQLLPETHQSFEGFKKYLSSKLYDQNRYKESLELLKSIKNPSDHEKTHILELLYFLNQRDEFENIYNELENKNAKNDALLINWLFSIKLHSDDSQKILELKEEIRLYLQGKINYDSANRARLALMKIYSILNEHKKATLLFAQLDHPSDNLISLFLKEFEYVPFMLEVYETHLSKEQEKKDFKLWIEKPTLFIPEIDKKETDTVLYKDCYFLTHKIKDVDLKWAVPITKNTFIAVNKEKELFLGEITHTCEIIKHSTIHLNKDKEYAFSYYDSTIYIATYDEGVHRYGVQENIIHPLEGVIKNDATIAKYVSIAIAEHYLFACNNESLEIFDLNTPDADPISSELYIDSGYSLHPHNDLLVVGAGGGLVLLIDCKDKKNPTYLSCVKEYKTSGNMHVAFIDNYMVSQSIIDITNPKHPTFAGPIWDEIAPTYYFSEKPKIPLYSTGDEFLFRTFVKSKNNNLKAVNWLENINKENLHHERLTSNLATMYNDKIVIGFTPYDICILEKGKNPKHSKKQFDIHTIIKNMVFECFKHLIQEHPDFRIGKVVLEAREEYGIISISFQECSSIALNIQVLDQPNLPIIHSTFNIYRYFEDVFDVDFDNRTIEMQYDLKTIVDELIKNQNFGKTASKHVAIQINNESQYLYFPDRPWTPYRESSASEDPETVEAILLSGNDNLIKKMSEEMIIDKEITEELIRILNLNPEKQKHIKNSTTPNNKTISSALTIQENKVSYIEYPVLNKKEKEKEEEEEINIQTLKKEAFKVLASHPDREIIREIIFNGAKYGIPKPVLKETPNQPTINQSYIAVLVKNWFGLWDEFSEDAKIKPFLLDIINEIKDENLQATLAYKYRLFTHPSIYNHIQEFFEDDYAVLDYYRYIEGDIIISKLPVQAIRPFEAKFFEILDKFETNDDDAIDRKVKEMIIPIYDMLYKLGHEKFPDKLLDKVHIIKRNKEQYDDSLFGDEDYIDEESFLLNIYRRIQVKNILSDFQSEEEKPIWDINLAPEPYKKSWYNILDLLLAKGEEVYGSDFRSIFIQKLSDNISKDKQYDNDRLLAFNFIHYTFKHIQKRPELASLAEELVVAIEQNKEKFAEEIDLYKIKEKSKYALLQAAWNDLKNKDWDLASQKCDAIIHIDPQLGQVYFLQARLVWLKEGIPTYLERKEEFIKKASHDAAALARLYNLTGCALDEEKQYEEALSYFKNAALTATNEPMYLANIAEIYYKIKNPKEAMNYVNKAKQQGHSSEMIDEIIQNEGIINEIDPENEN